MKDQISRRDFIWASYTASAGMMVSGCNFISNSKRKPNLLFILKYEPMIKKSFIRLFFAFGILSVLVAMNSPLPKLFLIGDSISIMFYRISTIEKPNKI